MSARAAPFAKAVKACRLDCLDGGHHRLLIFVGPTSWAAAKWYLGRGAPAERREGYVMVLPPDETTGAVQYRWPVDRRAVVLVDTGAGLRQLEPLVDALKRDGAVSCMHYEVQRDFPADDLEFQLSCLHLGHPVAPMVAWHDDAPAQAA